MATIDVKHFHSGMQGAPVLSNNWGDMILVLDACLVDGFNSMTATVARAGSTVTVTTSAPHGYQPYEVIAITGAEQEEYNGEWRVATITGPTSFTFTVTTSPVTPATGTITCKRASLNFEKAFAGTHKAAYRSKNIMSPRHFLRVDNGLKPDMGFGAYTTTWAKWSNVGIVENMTDIDTMVGAQAPFELGSPSKNWQSTQANQFGWHKWYHDFNVSSENAGSRGAGARNWFIVGDDRFFYFLTTLAPAFTWHGRAQYCFGDPISFRQNDAYSTMLGAHDVLLTNATMYYPDDNSARIFWESTNTGCVLLRDYTQFGGPVRFGSASINTTNGRKVSGGTNGIPFPNGPDNSLWLSQFFIRQENAHFRGIFPGARWIYQERPYSDMAIIENVTNETGKKFILPQFSFSYTNGGQAAFDITGPWR